MNPNLPILDLPPEGWSYKQHIALVGSDTVVILTMEKDPDPPSMWEELQTELGVGASDGILGVVLTLVLFWGRVSALFEKVRNVSKPNGS